MTENCLNDIYCGKFEWGNGEKNIHDMLVYILGENTYENLDVELQEYLSSHFNSYISKVKFAHSQDIFYLAMQGCRLTDIGIKISLSKERTRQIFLKTCRVARSFMLNTIKNYAVNKANETNKENIEVQLNQEIVDLKRKIEKLKIVRYEIECIEKKLNTLEPKTGILTMPIEDLNLSTRTYHCLRRYGKVYTVFDLTQKSKHDIRKLRNLGIKSCNEIERKLKELGLSLKETL